MAFSALVPWGTRTAWQWPSWEMTALCLSQHMAVSDFGTLWVHFGLPWKRNVCSFLVDIVMELLWEHFEHGYILLRLRKIVVYALGSEVFRGQCWTPLCVSGGTQHCLQVEVAFLHKGGGCPVELIGFVLREPQCHSVVPAQTLLVKQ